ncbi:CvpA family protein [Thalassobius sp. Cn5-15]|jgi:membrane protein required for colicin V production|uniref:CvpA family protein n=1 Tax=Thalassobius sp. Cn5-15 TaxID=2917763 RepID=UPI001EF38C06|nr:CvpA family protein [Thalassobius sp. Cn5-15]MCG7492872.1 CvpA family protein [Thalassobius sp. Cn5-15]
MDGFTIIDGVVALVIILSALLAYSRGVVREGLAIAGWILAAVLAFMFAPTVQPLVKEIPVLGEFIADSCELSMLGAAFVVAALVLVLASVFSPLFSSMIQKSVLGGLDQGLGFLFGVVRGVLLVAITFFVYETIAVGQEVAMVDNSRSAKVFSSMTGKIEERDPSASLGWITSKYEDLVSSCEL